MDSINVDLISGEIKRRR